MNNDWLSQLAPAHAPPPPGWWPPAPGWWGLALLLLAGAAGLTYWLNRPRRRLRRAALGELRQLETQVSEEARLASELEQLLRRFAVARYGRDGVAKLSGQRWVDFVVDHGGADWSGVTGPDILRLAYGGSARHRPVDPARWISGARGFIKGGA
jgi:hypothetical protein